MHKKVVTWEASDFGKEMGQNVGNIKKEGDRKLVTWERNGMGQKVGDFGKEGVIKLWT